MACHGLIIVVVTLVSWPLSRAVAQEHTSHLAAPSVRRSPELDSLFAGAARVAARLPDTVAARRAGYVRLRPSGALPAYNPIAGEHWLNNRYLRLPTVDPDHPAYLMYYPMAGGEQLIGLGYGLTQRVGEPQPEPFAIWNRGWHRHVHCDSIPKLGPVLVESEKQCRSLGGRPGGVQVGMGHVWLTPANPEGRLELMNIALAYAAAGVAPPTIAELKGPAAPRWRELALALGEGIGAHARLSYHVESGPDSARFRRGADSLRAELASLSGRLRKAERASDRTGYDRVVDQLVTTNRQLQALYLSCAGTPAVRQLLESWFAGVKQGHGLH